MTPAHGVVHSIVPMSGRFTVLCSRDTDAVSAASDQSSEFLDWQRKPGRSFAGALIGLVLAWLVGGALALGMVETEPGTAPVSENEFLFWMGVPLAIAMVSCASRHVRFWKGAFVPGAVAGWLLGCLTFLGLALLVVVL